MLVLGVAGLALAFWLVPRRTVEVPAPSIAAPDNSLTPHPPSAARLEPAVSSPQDEPPGETKRTTLTPRVSAVPAPVAVAASAPRLGPSPVTRQLVTSLSQLDVGHGPLTPEQAGAWKQTMQQLSEQKQVALPAIREFLQRNQDLSFDGVKGGNAVGYSSLRMGLLDALREIGGPEALAVSVGALQTTADRSAIAYKAWRRSRSRVRSTTSAAIRRAIPRSSRTCAAGGRQATKGMRYPEP